MNKAWCMATCLLLPFFFQYSLFAAPPEGSGYSWKLIIGDDFDGSSLDTSKWGYNYLWGSYHNSQANMKSSQVKIADGRLKLTAIAERSIWEPWGIQRSDFGWQNLDYTSGSIYSKKWFRYGYIEGRFQMPWQTSTWPAFWMLQNGWPPENDIFEVAGSRYQWYTCYHYGSSQSYGQWNTTGTGLHSSFNVFALNWQPTRMDYYFNDSWKYGVYDSSAISQSDYMYLLVTLAVGGWAPDPTASDYPATMQCDWIRVWQRNKDTNLDCISHLRMDETAGTIATDSSGKNKHGTLKNGLSFTDNSVPGKIGGALRFDGVDDYVELPAGFNEFDNGFTVTFWAYPTAVKNFARFIDLGHGTGDNNIVVARYGTTNDLTVRVYGGSTAAENVRATNAIELNRWQFFAVTISNSGAVRIYKDGKLIKTGTTTWPWGIWRTTNYIGRSNWAGDPYYQGDMDDIRIFDYALIPNEINDIYNADIPQPYGGTAAPIPGRIEAEHFDLGGEGVGYHDTTFGNSGGLFRPEENVDLRAVSDFGSGYAVTDIAPGEWLRYTTNVTEAGTYCLYLRASATSDNSPVIIRRAEVISPELPSFAAVGTYDEQSVQTNAVDYSMGYSSNAVWTTGVGQTLGAGQILTLAQFKPMVEEAFLTRNGGVINFDNIMLPTAFSFDVSFAEGAKKFSISSLSGSVQTGGPMANRTAVSGQTFLSTDGTPYYYLDFSDYSGMGVQKIVAIGVTLLGRSGTLSTSNWRVSANYTNGTDTGSSSTFRTINTGSGNATNDSFSGIKAPDGYWITGIRIHCDQDAYTSIDDLAFVFGNPAPAAPSTPAAETGGIASASQNPLDGITLGRILVNNTGSSDTFQTFVLNDVAIPEGNNQRLLLEFENGGLDVNWIQLEKQGPWGGVTHSLPGKIQAEAFDIGGPGRAYHDTTVGNSGGQFRTYENVDIISTTDSGGGYAIDNIQTGEWLIYTVSIAAGQTDVHARVASTQSGGQIRVLLEEDLLATITVPDTGSLTAWQTVTATGLTLSNTEKALLKLEFVGTEFRLNWIQFERQMPYPGDPSAIPGRIEFEHYDVGGPLISYYDTTVGNSYSDYRSDDVDIMVIGSAYAVYADNNEWLEYTVSPREGVYTLTVRSAGTDPDQQLTLTLDGELLAIVNLVAADNIFTFETSTITGIHLTDGRDRILRVAYTGAGANLDMLELKWRHNPADLNLTMQVDIADFEILASQWLSALGSPSADIAPLGGDGEVNLLDLLMLAENWLSGE